MECKENECKPKKDCCSSGCEMTDGIIKTAGEAWNQLLVEKMKAHFEKLAGEKIDKVALAGVKASMTLWQNKMKGKMEMQSEFENIKSTFKG